MISRWGWLVTQVTGRLWFWAALYGALAVATALAAIWLAPLIPDRISAEVGADAVEDILKIIASSMLAVATFSLSTMVAAFAATTSTTTPRAAQLLIEDRTAQNAIASFVGAFLYSLVGIVVLRTGLYGPSGRLILFGVTVVVILAVVVSFFRWIDHISRLGRLGEVVNKVEKVAQESILAQFASPNLGARPAVPLPDGLRSILSNEVGYLRHLDVGRIAKVAEGARGKIHVTKRPGSFVTMGEPVAWASWQPEDDETTAVRGAFLIGAERSFTQDPRFGFIVLSEVASRALSPGVNDPGTAIDIIGRAVRLLSYCAQKSETPAPEFKSVHVPKIAISDLFDDVFTPIAREGAKVIEVGIRLQKAFIALSTTGQQEFRDNAIRHSKLALRYADAALTLEEEKSVLKALATEVVQP